MVITSANATACRGHSHKANKQSTACPPTGGATATCRRDGGGGCFVGTRVRPPNRDGGGCAWSVGNTRSDGGDGDDGGSEGAGHNAAVMYVPEPDDPPGPAVGMTGTCGHSSRAANPAISSGSRNADAQGQSCHDLSNLKSQIDGRPSRALRSWPTFQATAAR